MVTVFCFFLGGGSGEWGAEACSHRTDDVHGGVGSGFFLACEDFWRMFENSFPACAFFFFFVSGD